MRQNNHEEYSSELLASMKPAITHIIECGLELTLRDSHRELFVFLSDALFDKGRALMVERYDDISQIRLEDYCELIDAIDSFNETDGFAKAGAISNALALASRYPVFNDYVCFVKAVAEKSWLICKEFSVVEGSSDEVSFLDLEKMGGISPVLSSLINDEYELLLLFGGEDEISQFPYRSTITALGEVLESRKLDQIASHAVPYLSSRFRAYAYEWFHRHLQCKFSDVVGDLKGLKDI